MGKLRALGLLLAAALAALALGGPAGAATRGPGASYTAQLSGGEEVPPRTTPASGQATFQVSADGMSLTYTVTVSNISNVTQGHIHIAPKGQNGDIVLPLVPPMPPGGGPKGGVVGQGTATAAQLTGPLQGKTLPDLVAQLDAGTAYVNLHTASGASPAAQVAGDLPAGEIRGQLVPTAMPAAPRTGGGAGWSGSPGAAAAPAAPAPSAQGRRAGVRPGGPPGQATPARCTAGRRPR